MRYGFANNSPYGLDISSCVIPVLSSDERERGSANGFRTCTMSVHGEESLGNEVREQTHYLREELYRVDYVNDYSHRLTMVK